jgi:hypothetical protein
MRNGEWLHGRDELQRNADGLLGSTDPADLQ